MASTLVLDTLTAVANSISVSPLVLASGGITEALSTVASAATPDIFAVTIGNVINYTGTTTATGFAAAPQAGARRTLVAAAACVFTAGANMLIDGVASASSYTAAAGDKINVIAVTTTQFRLTIDKTSGVPVTMSPIIASLGADVALNNTANYFDGPSIAQGTVGTWFVSGAVTITESSGANIQAKLWDGTTVIASGYPLIAGATRHVISLSGFIVSPAGNVRISVKDINNTTGLIIFNGSGNSKDSTITAIRIA